MGSKFEILIHHEIDLCAVLEEILTVDQRDSLKKAGGEDYQYDLTATVADMDNIRIDTIPSRELLRALYFIQQTLSADECDAFRLITISMLIRQVSAKYASSADAQNRAYWIADNACRASA
jgi:hypothetical protein